MNYIGRDALQLAKEFVGLTRRGVEALEKLNQEVDVSVDAGPPICPHCGVEDPQVQLVEGESIGPLSQVVIQATCMECDEILYAVVESYSMHRSQDTVQEELFYTKRNSGRAGNK